MKFQPGQSSNLKGRPKGSRNKLSEEFLRELADDFAEHGQALLASFQELLWPAVIEVLVDPLTKSRRPRAQCGE